MEYENMNPQPKQKTIRLSSAKYREFKKEIHRRDKWECCNPDCHCKVDKTMPPINYVLTIHHNVKRSQGGQDDEFNCVSVCMYCHDLIEKHMIDDGFVDDYLGKMYLQ
jgi:hypothetical protein